MDKKRQRGASKSGMSSPPRSTKGKQATAPCVPDIVTRTFDLVTSKQVLPFYILAGVFAFHYAPKAVSIECPRPLDYVIFNILPLVYLMQLVRQPYEDFCPYRDHARRYVLLGLALSIIGDGLLAWRPELYLTCWAGASCLAYGCYSIAYYQYYQSSKWSKLIIPISAILVGSLVYLIRDPQTSGFIVAYALFLTTLGFFALSRLVRCRSGPAYLGWAGVKLFALSNYLFALNLLVPSLGRPVSDTVIVMAYYLGQLGIALSTFTIQLCPTDGPSTSGRSSTPRRSDSSASVRRSRSRSRTSK
ncbi:transmembrane protein 86A [Elysia marginata]|uniref:lysoplasmalogenase n=1 Tax=Elysia marginata TaxID=1093978 RepID=A0AAV4EIG3_9GAST|nr:transmembrane protein 86A [Elysia marginata]